MPYGAPLRSATERIARQEVRAALPIWLWPLIAPFLKKLIEAFFASLLKAEAQQPSPDLPA